MTNITGTPNDDTLTGTSGDDLINGGQGSDTITGGDGNDRIEGLGSNLQNKSFDQDIANGFDGTGLQVPSWEADGSATVTAISGNGRLILGGDASVLQRTNIVYDPNEDYEFSAISINPGSNLPSNALKLDMYVEGSDGSLTLIASSGNLSINNATDGSQGYNIKNTVSTVDDSVSAPAGLEGNVVVKVTAVSLDANADDIIIADTSLTTTDLTITDDGDDIIDGGAGDDVILGQIGNDTIDGGDGNDDIIGGLGTDTIQGGAGDDAIAGSTGDDVIDGGDGNDTIFGDGYSINPPENDGTFFGGPGDNDWTFSAGAFGDYRVDDATGAIFLETSGNGGSSGGWASVSNPLGEIYDHTESYKVEFDYWAPADDVITSRFVVRLFIPGDPDAGLSQFQRLEVTRGGGWDAEGGATQKFSFEFGPRPDLAAYDGANMRLQIRPWSDGLDPDATREQGVFINNVQVSSSDPLWGVQSSTDLTANPVNDDANNDIIDGGAGDDTIYGMEGNDTLIGGDGDDTVEGGAGNDTITIGLGDTVISDDVYATDGVTITEAGVAGYDADTFIIDGETTSTSGSTKIIVDGGTGTTSGDEADDFDTIDWLSLVDLHGKPEIVKTLDADGNSYSGTATFTTSAGEQIVVEFKEMEVVPCFTRGTMIEGANGLVAVEDIKAGDLIMTKDNGLKPVIWASSRQASFAEVELHGKLFPVRISAGALGQGLPKRDLIVSPQHRILVSSNVAQRIVGTREVLVAAKELVAIEGIDFVTEFDEVEYFHFMFDQHEVVLAEGAEAESLYAGPEILPTLPEEVREEVLALFPEIEGMDLSELVAKPARDILQGSRARKMIDAHARQERPLLS